MRAVRSMALLLALPSLLSACSDDTAAGTDPRGELSRSVNMGEAFRLSPGQRARIGNLIVIGFRGVAQDSRCAVDVVCVWAGDGEAVLSVAVGRETARTVSLHTTVDPREVAFGTLVVRLVDLEPAPVSTRRIEPDEYVATLLVERSLSTTR